MGEDKDIDRRTKIYKDLVLNMPKNDGTITENIDGQDFKYMPEPRCRVCSADDPAKDLKNGVTVRDLVDRLLLYPMSVAGVLRYIEPLMEDWPDKYRITAKSVRTHLKKHLPWDKAAMRYMVEKWANQKGIQVMDSAGRMVLTEEAWLEATAQLGWQRMQSGDIEPSWAETQKSFERMQNIRDMAEGVYSTTYLIARLNKIINAVREIVPEQYLPAILAKLEEDEESLPIPALTGDEVLEGLLEEAVEPIDDPEIVEAVIVEEVAVDEDTAELEALFEDK